VTDISFDQVIRSRRTTRAYRVDPVPESVLQELVEIATLAPTGMNAQPWRFSIVTNRATLKGVSDAVKRIGLAMTPQVPEMERLRPAFENQDYEIFYGAPALVVIQGDRRSPIASMDCLLAAENLILAAHARNLGTCFMGFIMLAKDNEGIRRALSTEEGYDIIAPIIVGYSDAIPQTPPDRRPPEIAWVR